MAGQIENRCHFGRLIKLTKFDIEMLEINHIDMQVMECTNSRCSEKYCKYSFFSGGLIPDMECPHFLKMGAKDDRD